MRYIVFVLGIFVTFNILSCKTPRNEKKDKEEIINETPSLIINEDGTATIIGRVHLDSHGRSDLYYYVEIKDEYGTIYNISPPEKQEELRRYQNRLIKFVVIVHDNPLGYGRKTVTPLSWEIIEGDPVSPSPTPKVRELGVVQVTGVVSIVYVTPRVFMNIVGDNNEHWIISSDEVGNFMGLNGSKITVEGEGFATDLGLLDIQRRSDGAVFALEQLSLRNIRIIEIHNEFVIQ